MAKKFGDDVLIYSWMRNRNTLEFIGIWEQLHNPDFKGLEFETFRNQAGLNSFSLTPRKWIEATGAIGFQSRAGRYGGGTYAHKDIAFEFGSWLSPEFKLYLIKEFQRLAADLRKAFPGMEGLSSRNLLSMKLLAAAFPEGEIAKQPVSQLPWGHIIRLLQMVKESAARDFYIQQTITQGWSRSILEIQIEQQLQLRLGQAQNNFPR